MAANHIRYQTDHTLAGGPDNSEPPKLHQKPTVLLEQVNVISLCPSKRPKLTKTRLTALQPAAAKTQPQLSSLAVGVNGERKAEVAPFHRRSQPGLDIAKVPCTCLFSSFLSGNEGARSEWHTVPICCAGRDADSRCHVMHQSVEYAAMQGSMWMSSHLMSHLTSLLTPSDLTG